MASFDKTTVKFLQNLHFYRNVLKFVLGFISGFYAKLDSMKTNVDENQSNPKWDVSTSVKFKKFITKHQYRPPLRHMKKNDMESIQEGKSLSISCWLYDTSNA